MLAVDGGKVIRSSSKRGKRVAGTVSKLCRIVARVGPTIRVVGTTVSTEAPKRSSRKGIPNHPFAFRRRLGKLACEPGVSVARLPMEHGLNPNLLFKWRRALHAGEYDPVGLLPVTVEATAPEIERPTPVTTPVIGVATLEPSRSLHDRTAQPHEGLDGRGSDRHASGFNCLAAKVQTVLERDPFSGHVFVFRGKRGDLVKVLWWSGAGTCLLTKRLERGRFVWQRADGGVVCLSQTQLSMLPEGIDWRQPIRTAGPTNQPAAA